MKYLLTAISAGDTETIKKQIILDEQATLNMVRKFILHCASMDETSADLRAIAFMNDIKPGKACAIEHPNGVRMLKVQIH